MAGRRVLWNKRRGLGVGARTRSLVHAIVHFLHPLCCYRVPETGRCMFIAWASCLGRSNALQWQA